MAKFEFNDEQIEDLMESGLLDNLDVQCKSLNQKIIRKSKMIDFDKSALKENAQQQDQEIVR